MTEHFKPGTIAVATVRGVPDIRVMRTVDGWWLSFARFNDDVYHATADLADIRRLVVLNLEHPEDEVAYLRSAATHVLNAAGHSILRRLADEIREQTRPRPAEPAGLGAVVEVDGGVRFVRLPDGMWTSEDESQPWHHLNVVRVLSEGVAA